MTRMRARQRGVALLEVGLALVVLSTALLAMAMLLTNTARGLRSGQAMVKAAALASDISEQMRSNPAAVQAVGADRGFKKEGSYDALSTPDAVTTPSCGGGGLVACTRAKDFADFAVASWQTQAQNSLPSGAASLIDLDLNRRRIVLAWKEPVTDRVNGVITPFTDSKCFLGTLAAPVAVPSGVRCLTLEFSL